MNGAAPPPAPDLEEIRAAAHRIRPLVHHTPVLTSRALDDACGARLFFKCENLQRTGSFKLRGAANAVALLAEGDKPACVATHSSGNHGAALALAARDRGIPCHVVMPRTAPRIKRQAVRGYGAVVTPCEPTLASREETLAGLVESTGAVMVPPYNDFRIIAGQGTAALEMMGEIEDLNMVLVPVGGGGLISGTAIAARALAPGTRVIGVEPTAAADAQQSFREDRIIPHAAAPDTIADGLLTSLGDRTFAIIRSHVDDMVTVSEAGIVAAMRLVLERMKILIEPSAAVPLAAVLEGSVDVTGRRIGIILSGGNVDVDRLPWIGGSGGEAP